MHLQYFRNFPTINDVHGSRLSIKAAVALVFYLTVNYIVVNSVSVSLGLYSKVIFDRFCKITKSQVANSHTGFLTSQDLYLMIFCIWALQTYLKRTICFDLYDIQIQVSHDRGTSKVLTYSNDPYLDSVRRTK